MLRRSHRRRPPVPVWVGAALFVVSAAAVVTALVVRDPWLLRGTVAVLTAVLLVNVWLLRRMRRMLRRAQVEAAGTSSALARAETRASQELLRRDHEIARLDGELETASAQLAVVTGASLYAATVLAELLRNNPLLNVTESGDGASEPAADVADGDLDVDADSADAAASSTVVQVWPSIDDAPTVVDLLRWDQVRRMTDEEPKVGDRRPA